MVTHNTELHARNIAAINAHNDQNDIDIRLAAELQATIDRVSPILQRAATKSALKLDPIVSDRKAR